MADERLRHLERMYKSSGDRKDWAVLQNTKRRSDLPYERTYILHVQSHEKILRIKGPQHGEHLLITKLSNGWNVETWWDDNEWDDPDHENYEEQIGWTTLVFDHDEAQIGSAMYCEHFDCAIKHHQEKVQGIIEGTIEDYEGSSPLWEAEPRRNPDIPFYHGSPYSGMKNTSDFEGRYLFLTPSRSVASSYTTTLPASGRRPQLFEVEDQKTIYTLRITTLPHEIFDTRNDEHQQLYTEIRDELKYELDPEDWPSRDLTATPNIPDSPISLGGYFPDFGSGLNIIPKLQELGFRALWVSEGSQGASLGLFYSEDAEIISTEYLD